MDNNLHLSLKKGLVSYVLMVLRKNEATPKETLLNENRQKLAAPTPYSQILRQQPELSIDSQGFFGKREPAVIDLVTEADDLEQELIDVITREVKEILKYEEEEINSDMTFEALGVKSLNAVEIVGALNTKLDLYLKTTLLFSYPTITALGKHILGQYGEEFRRRRLPAKPNDDHKNQAVDLPPAEPAEDLSTLFSEIETMSPAEIEALSAMLEGINHD
jgi:acyl carrier protein